MGIIEGLSSQCTFRKHLLSGYPHSANANRIFAFLAELPIPEKILVLTFLSLWHKRFIGRA
jgi:hypothetical protein